MSRETTTTTTSGNTVQHGSELLRSKFDMVKLRGKLAVEALRGSAVVDTDLPLKTLDQPIEEKTVRLQSTIAPDGTYRLTSENLTKSRMTINSLDDDERQDISEYEAPQERVRRSLGRRALDFLKHPKAWMDLAIVNTASKMPGIASQQDIDEAIAARNVRYAKKDTDSWMTRIYKYARRNQYKVRNWAPVMALGGAAVQRYMPGGLALMDAGSTAIAHGPQALSAAGNYYNSLYVPEAEYHTLEVVTAAKTNFYIGGATDTTGDMFVAQEKAAGRYDAMEINKQANYSASIGPFVGQERMDSSTDEAARQATAAYREANGAPFEIRAFSEGTVGAVKAAQQIAAENGGTVPSNVTIVLDGGPSGEMGFGKSAYAGAVSPFLEAAGIDLENDIPPGTNVIVRSYSGDLWGNGGKQTGATQLAMAAGIPNNHLPVDESKSVLLRREVINGVTYEEWGFAEGPQHPLARIPHDQGLYVSPAVDNWLDAALPVTHLGEETQYANAGELGDASAEVVRDTIQFHTGIDSPIPAQVEQAIMTPERTDDLQNMLDLQQTGDTIARIAQDPAANAHEIPQVVDDINQAITTGVEYLDPNKWIDVINDGAQGAGVNLQLQHIQPVEQTYVPSAPVVTESAPIAPPLPPATPEVNQMVTDGLNQLQDFLSGVKIPR